ncbi:MAG: metalloprotease PmbA [Gammaproteobacteria bacterium]|nr:metalloprotease PmbA [Gammaproteobacteria bacterium]NIR98800.1 metalloprotease PmbA [Gammaproteobacteria bacterium]NIT64510.1 metalloprotease PmbA [Gammaproteobacteria bacterium]NIV21430.1 metalloprotease PmbA [Gammaproteobacteria bacterium]NIX11300.1 metalloprotease PmbA [Gammaproteobacteria bacterium]
MSGDDESVVEQSFPEQSELEALAREALREAHAQGASAAEAGVSFGAGLSVTVRLGEVETLEFNRDRGLGVTVYVGQRKGSANTSDWSRAAIKETVAAACTIARFTSEDECAGLADARLMASQVPDLDLFHPWALEAEAAIELARTCEEAARALDGRISNSEGGTVSAHQGISVYGNAHGFLGGYAGTRHAISCSVIGRQGESMQRDYWYTTARDAGELERAESVGRRAAERTVRRLGARRLTTRRAPVVFAAEIATGVLGHLVAAVRGGKLYRNASFLVDHLGRQIFPRHVHIVERPHLPKALGSAPFDGEGVVTRDRELVSEGVLRGYVLDSYSARKLGMETTGNAGGVHNLSIRPGRHDLAGLLRQMDTGLLVTEVMGHGVNYVTGDYSRGAAGFWVENGELQYPVEEITIAGNLHEMFMNLAEVGTDVDIRGTIRTGSLLIEDMMIAGE